MFTVSKKSDNRIDIEIKGKLDAGTMRAALDDLVAKAEGVEGGRMLYTISDFAFPTLGALAVDFGKIPSLFSMIRKISKCAVIADASWLRAIAEVEGALFPGLEIKAFAMDEVAEAEAWLANEGG